MSNGVISPQAPVAPQAPAAPRTSGFAIASLVLGICWLWGIGSVLAIIFGAKARKEIDAGNGWITGRGMASWGFWLGIVGTVCVALFIVAIVIAAANDPTPATTYRYR
jgi:Domain of unknown function (DUF4190)